MFLVVPCKVASGFQNEVSLGVYGCLFFGRWERGNSVCFRGCVPVSVFLALLCLIIWSWINLILKQNIWAGSNWEDVYWWWSSKAMYGFRPWLCGTHSAIDGFPGLQIQCSFSKFSNLVWKVTVKAGNIGARLQRKLWVFFRSWFFSLLWWKLGFQSVYTWFGKEKGFPKCQEERGELHTKRRKLTHHWRFLFSVFRFTPLMTPARGTSVIQPVLNVKTRFSSRFTSSTSLCFLGREYMMPMSHPI